MFGTTDDALKVHLLHKTRIMFGAMVVRNNKPFAHRIPSASNGRVNYEIADRRSMFSGTFSNRNLGHSLVHQESSFF